MPLESLRWDITPPGLHYLLTHYDIPAIDPTTFELVIDGLVRTPLSLDLDSIRNRPQVSAVDNGECAGMAGAMGPRPVSQPWLFEAVGTARWGGTLLSDLLQEAAGIAEEAVDVVPTGADHGIERGFGRTTNERCRSRRCMQRRSAGV